MPTKLCSILFIASATRYILCTNSRRRQISYVVGRSHRLVVGALDLGPDVAEGIVVLEVLLVLELLLQAVLMLDLLVVGLLLRLGELDRVARLD